MSSNFKELWLSILNKNFAETKDKKEALLKTFRELRDRSDEFAKSLGMETKND